MKYKDFKTLSNDDMKNIIGGEIPPDHGNCVFTGTRCGPISQGGRCISHWTDNECCCSVDGPGHNEECHV